MDNAKSHGAISADLEKKLSDLVKACRILEIHGHSDRIWGHVAMRDPEGRGFWLKRHTISLGEVFDAGDFQLCDFDGKVLHGEGIRHSEWPIHGEILRLRTDMNYTAHTHPFYSSIFSSISESVRQVRGGSPEPPPRYEGSSELVVTKERGLELAESLGGHLAVFMRNHGVAFCGASAVEMVRTGIELEQTCHQMLVVNGSGLSWAWPDDAEQVRKKSNAKMMISDDPLWAYYCRLLERAEARRDPRLSSAPVDNR